MKIKWNNQLIDEWLQIHNASIIRVGVYGGIRKPILWQCKLDGFQWLAAPSTILHNSTGCPRCSGCEKLTNDSIDEFLSNNNMPIKRLENVINNKTPICWRCDICNHKWKTSPSKIKNQKTGCPKCSNRIKKTNAAVDEQLTLLRLPIVRLGEYISTHTKIDWQCQKCFAIWSATPANVLTQHTGCPQCRTPNYSKAAIRWLQSIEQNQNIAIRHAENGGEFTIPGTSLKVDGYCKETNTIYEFHADIFHGNPKKFNRTELCSPYHTLTAGELFDRTMKKEEAIKQLGYNLIIIWESDFGK